MPYNKILQAERKGVLMKVNGLTESEKVTMKCVWDLGDGARLAHIMEVANGKYKKTYIITDSGKRCFFEWVNSPFEVQNIKNPELVKVYFMGFSDKTSRRGNIEKYLSHLTEKYHVLNAICEEAQNVNITEENKDIIFYQLSAARYGRDFMKFNIEWYKKLINEMEDK